MKAVSPMVAALVNAVRSLPYPGEQAVVSRTKAGFLKIGFEGGPAYFRQMYQVDISPERMGWAELVRKGIVKDVFRITRFNEDLSKLPEGMKTVVRAGKQGWWANDYENIIVIWPDNTVMYTRERDVLMSIILDLVKQTK